MKFFFEQGVMYWMVPQKTGLVKNELVVEILSYFIILFILDFQVFAQIFCIIQSWIN